MKNKEINKLTNDELNNKISSLKKDLAKVMTNLNKKKKI